jgi:hypothetical protein
MGDLPPASPAPPVEAKKLPPPSPAAQEEAGRLMDDIYKISQAKTPKQKLEVANELFTLGRSPQVKPDERFVLLRKTVDLAVEGGDMPLVLAAIRQAAGEFEFDSLAAEEKALARVAQRPMDAARTKAFFAGVTQVIEEALAAERNEPAQELLALARQVSQRKEGKDYRPLMDRFQADIAKVSAHRGAIHSAETALASNPDDPEANRSMGAHYCLVEGDWEHGLACLAKGGDPRVRTLAAEDLSTPAGQPEEQMKRAGQWWELAQAERGTIHDVSMLRAGFWYERARARLAAGLMRLSAEQRLGEIAAQGELLRK